MQRRFSVGSVMCHRERWDGRQLMVVVLASASWTLIIDGEQPNSQDLESKITLGAFLPRTGSGAYTIDDIPKCNVALIMAS
eukprot:scaffold134_cov94-Amphora_coffeaeformis.AAC.4